MKSFFPANPVRKARDKIIYLVRKIFSNGVKIILFVVIITAAFFAALLFFRGKSDEAETEPYSITQNIKGDILGMFETKNNNDRGAASDILNETENINLTQSGYKLYSSAKYGFSFEYPEEMNITNFEEAGGDIIFLQDTNKTQSPETQNIGFQVFVMPFDETGPITPARIKRDLPQMVVYEPRNVIIGKDRFPALIFFAEDSGFGRSREVWFVYPTEPYPNGNYLYQVSTYAGLDAMIGRVMESWRFQ